MITKNTTHSSFALYSPPLAPMGSFLFFSLMSSTLLFFKIYNRLHFLYYCTLEEAFQFPAQILSPHPGFSQPCLREEPAVLQVLTSWTGVLLEEKDASDSKDVEEHEQQHQEEGHALEAIISSHRWVRLDRSLMTARSSPSGNPQQTRTRTPQLRHPSQQAYPRPLLVRPGTLDKTLLALLVPFRLVSF